MIDKIGRFFLPKSVDCHAELPDFVGRQNWPILSAKVEHVTSSTILSADFLYIR